MKMLFSYPDLVVQTQNVTSDLLNKIQGRRGKGFIAKTQKIYPEKSSVRGCIAHFLVALRVTCANEVNSHDS